MIFCSFYSINTRDQTRSIILVHHLEQVPVLTCCGYVCCGYKQHINEFWKNYNDTGIRVKSLIATM